MYIHERKDWPQFTWDQAALAGLLAKVRHLQGRLLGRMEAIGFPLCAEATLEMLTQDVLKTSEIEGEKLDLQQVRSSIARRLGLDIGGSYVSSPRNVEGIVEMMIDATRHYDKPLNKTRLYHWYAALFPTGLSGMQQITVGKWRTETTGPMQVVSGPIGHEKVHYEAPRYDRLNKEMAAFIQWFNTKPNIDLVLSAALAHFWFITIHPFDDGNGRIARALADMMLARSEGSSQRFYSMSSQIQHERNEYYNVLERSQKSTLDITAWIEWFLGCLQRAIEASNSTLESVLAKAHFWKAHSHHPFNDRQRAILNRLINEGFEGKLTSSKWAKLVKCSQDTALRDIADLVDQGILLKSDASGRSTSYHIRIPPHNSFSLTP